MSLFRKSRPKSNPQLVSEQPYHPVWSNFMELIVTNFKLIPFLLPSLILLLCFLFFGGLIFLAGALVLLLPAAPAVVAMYDVGYQLTREVEKHDRRKFLQSYKLNFRQSVAAMALQLPFIAIMVIIALTTVERPIWVNLCIILGSVLLMAFGVLSFSQIALVDLPLKKLLKNALILIPMTTWRAVTAGVVQLLFIIVLYQYIAVTILLFLFAGPAVLIVWSCKILWPSLEVTLLDTAG